MSAASLKKTPATAESYRTPVQVTQLRIYQSTAYYICPRCGDRSWEDFLPYFFLRGHHSRRDN